MTHALQVHLPAEFEDKFRSAIGQVFARRIRTRCSLLLAPIRADRMRRNSQ